MTFNHDNVVILGKRKGQSCTELCKALLKMAKDGEMSSLAVVIIPRKGEWRISGAGTDVDGMLEGTIALHNSLVTLLEKEQNSPSVIHDQRTH